MELGMVGLGKLGANMTVRLVEAGHRLVVTDRNDDAVEGAVDKGAVASDSLADLVERLERPRAVWVMVPSGDPTEGVVTELAELVDEGDIVIDGGNSNYKDTMRRAKSVEEKGDLLRRRWHQRRRVGPERGLQHDGGR